MKTIIRLLFFFLSATLLIDAQDSVQYHFELKLRKSFQSEDSKPEAATFTYTKPKNRNESYLIDAALGLKMVGLPNLSMSAFGEYHRNTLVDKVQNAIQSGFALEWYTNSSFNTDDSEQNSHTAIINCTAKYSDNIIDKIESIQSTCEITFLLTRSNRTNCILPNVTNRIGTIFNSQYFPAVGYEWEDRIQCKNDSAKGNIVRAVGKIHVSIFPLPVVFKSCIELFCDLAYRYDILNSTRYTEYSHPWLQSGINLVLFNDNKSSTKLSASFNKGSSAAQGLKDQEYILVALKIKI